MMTLRAMGWSGRFIDDASVDLPWWLGVPSLSSSRDYQFVKCRIWRGVALGIVSRGRAILSREDADRAVDFRLEFGESAHNSVLARMLEGSVRFSWICSPAETAVRFGIPRTPSFARFSHLAAWNVALRFLCLSN
jgi:hypothetical protein